MTETTPIPTAAASRQAPPIRISVQYRKEGSEAATDQPIAIKWDTFTKAFHKPHWHGKEPLARYCQRYEEDIFECESIPAREWQPVSFKSEAAKGGDIKYAENMLLHAVVFDLENGASSYEICRQLHGLKALVHSTYRHSPNAPRWRVILPLWHAVEPSNWLLMRDALLHRFDALLDTEEARQPWSWYRLPACPPDTKEHYTVFQLDGRPLRMTPEFQLECARSLQSKLHARSRANTPEAHATASKGATPLLSHIDAPQPVATPPLSRQPTLTRSTTQPRRWRSRWRPPPRLPTALPTSQNLHIQSRPFHSRPVLRVTKT